MIDRRAFLQLPAFCLITACGRRRRGPGFRGYAFIANQDGNSIAALDLEAMAVARHIPLNGAPTTVITALKRPFAYALASATCTIHEIGLDHLAVGNRVTVGGHAHGMQMAPDESALYVLTSEPHVLARVDATTLKVDFKIALPDAPVDFAISPDNKTAAISFSTAVRLVDLEPRKLRPPSGTGNFGAVRAVLVQLRDAWSRSAQALEATAILPIETRRN